MALIWYYEAEVGGGSEEITDRVRLYTMSVTQDAEEGSVATSSVTIDDPAGDYDITGWRRIRAFEDTATGSNTHVYSGFVTDRTVHRGVLAPTGAARQWVVNMVDSNVVLSLRILTAADANRPAETDVARLTWLLAALGTPNIPVTTFFNTTGPVAMDAVDYRGQTRYDVINDCAQASGKNFFVYTRDTSFFNLDLGFWYDFAGSTAYTSSVRLTNVLSDLDELTFAIADDTELRRSPDRVYSGAYVRYDGGAVIEESIATSNLFTRRDGIVPADNVKTQAKATARALRYLSEMSTEEDRITTAIRIPAAKVNFVREGMRAQFKATHLPGYTDWTWGRVLRRTVTQDSEQEYLVGLELSITPGSEAVGECSVLAQNYSSLLYDIPTGPTPAGFYPINSTHGTSGDYVAGGSYGNVFYLGGFVRPRPRPGCPANGLMGGWSFSNHSASAPSMPGGIGDGGLAPSVQIIVVGPGTMTIWLADTGAGAATAELYRAAMPVPDDGSFDEPTLIETKAATFTTTTFVVPDDGECLHYAVINYNSGSYLYGGFTWTPA